MFDMTVLIYDYSFNSLRHFIKFLIKGLDEESEEKLVETVNQIPEGILNVSKLFRRISDLI